MEAKTKTCKIEKMILFISLLKILKIQQNNFSEWCISFIRKIISVNVCEETENQLCKDERKIN